MKMKNITTAILILVAAGLMAQDNVDDQKVSPDEQKLMDEKQELTVERGKVTSQLTEINKKLRKEKNKILRNDKDIKTILKQIDALNKKIDNIIDKKYPDVGDLQKQSKALTEQFADLCSKQKEVIIELKKLNSDK